MESHFATSDQLYLAYLRHPRVRIDSREVAEGDLFVALAGERTNGNEYAKSALDRGAAYVIVDEEDVLPASADDRYLLVPDSLTALQELAARHRREFKMPVLAITGSNGKTTTKELVAAVMGRQYRVHATPGNYNNHIGLPLTILGMPKGTEFLILEMGANHQGEIRDLCAIGRPTHGLITNVGDAHLEGFGGREGVRRGKGELYDFLAAHRAIAFVNGDEEWLPAMAERVDRTVFYRDSDAPSPEVRDMEIHTLAVQPRIRVSFLSGTASQNGGSTASVPVTAEIDLAGAHNLQNVKTAIGIGKYFKVPGVEIAAALSTYVPSNHRSQRLTHRGVDFLWDAYNANPSSVQATLTAFDQHPRSPNERIILLGEMLELGEAAPAAHRRVVLRAGQVAATVLLVGREMEAVAREFGRPWFADVDALRGWFWRQDWSGKTVLVKGSRGNRLERLLDESAEVK